MVSLTTNIIGFFFSRVDDIISSYASLFFYESDVKEKRSYTDEQAYKEASKRKHKMKIRELK
jgi:hypothetical protein